MTRYVAHTPPPPPPVEKYGTVYFCEAAGGVCRMG
jgi:hypothetical protein